MPVIGVMPLWDEERGSIWMLPGYLDGILEAGGTPVILPFTDDAAEIAALSALCDGYLFTGGQDVNPACYGEPPCNDSVVFCRRRDILEQHFLRDALSHDKPVLGICRGIQFINVMLGGTLCQDLPTGHPSPVEHHQQPPYHLPVHSVHPGPGTPLWQLHPAGDIPVNSLHHQAVRTLAPGLRAMAISEDGLVEALYHPDHRFLWAVQWHPEFSFRTDPLSRAIFSAFLQAFPCD